MSINDFLSGAAGGMAGVIIGFPFDTTKLQMQIRTSGKARTNYKEVISNLSKLDYKHGFFRGMAFPLCSIAIVNSMFFGVFAHIMSYMPRTEGKLTETWKVLCSATVAAASTLIISCPVEVVKCTLQSQIPDAKNNYSPSMLTWSPKLTLLPREKSIKLNKFHSNAGSCALDIYKIEGIAGFYRGIVPMFARDVPSYGLYLFVYDSILTRIKHYGFRDSSLLQKSFCVSLAGGFAGMVSWTVVMPFDVIKSRLQVDRFGRYNGFLHCLQSTVNHAGPSVLFRGSRVAMIRAFPVNAGTFLTSFLVSELLETINPH